MVRVQLVQATCLLPQQHAFVKVRIEGAPENTVPWMLEPDIDFEPGICAEPTLVAPDREIRVMLTKTTGFTRHLDEGTMVGVAERIEVLSETSTTPASVQQVTSDPERSQWCRGRVSELFQEVSILQEDRAKHLDFLMTTTTYSQYKRMREVKRTKYNSTLTQVKLLQGSSVVVTCCLRSEKKYHSIYRRWRMQE